MTDPARPLPPRPASGGSWRFDPDLWAYVPAGATAEPGPAAAEPAPPDPGAPLEPGLQAPVEPPVAPAPKPSKEPRK